MRVLLYLQVKPAERIGFGNPWAKWMSENHPGVQLLDADNHSEDWLVSEQLKMLANSSKVVIILDLAENAKPGKAVKLLEKALRDQRIETLIFVQGENQLVEKMLKLSQKGFHKNTDENGIRKQISAFLRS